MNTLTQTLMPIAAKYTVDDLEALILKIQTATGLTQSEIEKLANYNPGYLSQVKNKGRVPEKLIQSLTYRFQDELNSVAIDSRQALALIVERVLVLQAHQDVYGGLLVEVLAHLRNTSTTALVEEVNTLLNRRLQKLKDELKS